jgi:Fic-DOC domain mobile mystery protein B
MNKKHLPINDNIPYGATELSIDDLEGLIPNYVTTREDLNEFEKANITKAVLWLQRKGFKPQQLLTLEVFFELHLKMFDKTWKWAGRLRRSTVNIGVTPIEQLQMQIKNVLDNTKYWIDHKSFSIDEICVRFHHAIVWIHPFPNGNGRFSRIVCDELRKSLGVKYFTWGQSENNLVTSGESRTKYIIALRAADKKDFKSLIDFAKS